MLDLSNAVVSIGAVILPNAYLGSYCLYVAAGVHSYVQGYCILVMKHGVYSLGRVVFFGWGR